MYNTGDLYHPLPGIRCRQDGQAQQVHSQELVSELSAHLFRTIGQGSMVLALSVPQLGPLGRTQPLVDLGALYVQSTWRVAALEDVQLLLQQFARDGGSYSARLCQ
jgi:hypothetical protein